MKIVRSGKLDYVPASHEHPDDPGCVKKVLLTKEDLVAGRVQMVNWSKLPGGKSFEKHYHEDMEEVFVILSGRARITVNGEEAPLDKGDAVVIPIGKVHQMANLGSEDVEYLAMGVALGTGGRTIVV